MDKIADCLRQWEQKAVRSINRPIRPKPSMPLFVVMNSLHRCPAGPAQACS